MSRERLDEESNAGEVVSNEISAPALVVHEHAITVVPMPAEKDQATTCCGSLLVYNSLLVGVLSTAAHHFINFTKIFLLTTALLARWLHQFYLELNRYDLEPTKIAQETWLSFVELGIAAFLSIIAKALNYRYKETKYTEYLHAAFSSSVLYYGLDIVSSEGKTGSMPLACFIVSSCIFLPLVISFFFKWTVSDSHHELIYSLTQLNKLNPQRYPFATLNERRLNIIMGLKYGIPSATAFVWNVNREVYGETVGAPVWQKCLMAMYFIIVGKIGFELTDHPKFFQGFAAFSKLIKSGSLSYAALSGIFSIYVAYHCENKKTCLDSATRTQFTYICFSLAFMMGLYSAATTRFQFEKNHQGNENLITAIQNAPATFHAKKAEVIDGCSSALLKMENGLSQCFSFFKEKIEKCCHRDTTVQPTEADALTIPIGNENAKWSLTLI